ncbi:MAG TPA: glycosyltransferase family 87 protein, partial [Candidatus Acidoferrales bacterium]|nr:glycosyltransferase family 87 protein [Candidatus Acidoferrales bacterium]
AINVVLLLLSWHILRNQSSAGAQPFRQLILWSLFLPVWIALIQGQFSILLLFSFAVAFWCLKRGRDYLGGLALGLGLFKFPIVLPFALIFLLRRKWRFIGGLTTAAGTLSLVSVMAIGRPGVLSYINLLADIMRHPANPAYATIEPWNMPTVRGFVMGILGSHIAEGWITPVAGVLSVCMILITVWRWKSNESGDNGQNFELMFGAALAVSLVTAPHLYVHDLTPLLLVIGLVVSSARWAAKSTADIIFIAGISILYALPFYYLKLLASNEVYVLAPFIVAIALAVMNMACRPALSDRAVGGMHPPSHVGVTS